MSVISLLKVDVLQNPAPIDAPYEFEIMFQCFEPLQKDIEWKLTYVGSATSSEYDQELVSALVGPIPVGVNKFTLEGNPPDFSRIPDNEVLGVTVMLLSCSYDGREFVRVGYYVNNEVPEENLNDKPTPKPMRNILSEKPRVTRFAIKWDSEESAPAEFPPDQPEADTVEDDEAAYAAEELAAEEEELAAEDAEAEGAAAEGEDAEMGGTEEAAHAKDDDAASDAGSEDLEAESSGEDDEEDEEEAEEEMEMEEGDDKAASGAAANEQQAGQQHADVMVH